MKSKNGKAIAVILSFVAIAGVIGYVLYRRKKAKQSQSGGDSSLPETTPQSTPSSGGGYSFPFKTTDEGNKFRVWVNTNYPAYAKQISLDKSGLLNSYVDKAWKVYGNEYTTKVLNTSTTSTPPKPVIAQGQAWTNSLYTGLYVNVNDNAPYRNAGLYEYIGTTDGKTYTDYYGRKYYKMKAKWDGIDTLYVKQQFVTFKKP